MTGNATMRKNMTVGKKIGIGFGAVLVVLGIVVALSFTGVGGIVDNAEQVIYGNSLDANMAQKEVDHLNWANKVSDLLTDDQVTKLEAQTDDHKCGFGKWLYGDARKDAEANVPGLADILKKIEGPHSELHASAIDIGRQFHQADASLPQFLTQLPQLATMMCRKSLCTNKRFRKVFTTWRSFSIARAASDRASEGVFAGVRRGA